MCTESHEIFMSGHGITCSLKVFMIIGDSKGRKISVSGVTNSGGKCWISGSINGIIPNRVKQNRLQTQNPFYFLTGLLRFQEAVHGL